MEHLPRGIEQRVMCVRGRHGYLFRLLAGTPPPLLRKNQMWVCGTPASPAFAFGLGVLRAPGPKVIGGSSPQAAVRLAYLLAATLRVAGPVARFTLTRSLASRAGIVTGMCARLVDSQADSVRELTSAGMASLSRHGLR